jgi:arsenic resistance protein ArsH
MRHLARVVSSTSFLSFRLLVLSSTVNNTCARTFVVQTANKSLIGGRTGSNVNGWIHNNIQNLRGGSSVTTATIRTNTTDSEDNMCATDATGSIWSGDDKEAFASLQHAGYTIESDPVTHTGGWLAHRAAWETQEDGAVAPCWIKDEVIEKLTKYDYSTMPIGRGPRILILYGSLRPTSFSRKLAYEFARLLELLGCDVRVYNPRGLPVRDPSLENELKVLEIRALSHWSEGHVWVSPEMHGTITGTFKNQIDWIPLNTGSVRPTQGRTCLVAQVNGGSQSFNGVNALRLLARWMRMPCNTNQSSIAMAWKEFEDDTGRMKDSSFRDRVVDCAEEFAKFSAVMTPIADELTDRYSERKEKEEKGRLLTQSEKEKVKTIEESRKG